MKTRVAFLGLGTMGGPMAANLAAAGFDVAGWNRSSGRPGVEAARAGGVRMTSTVAEAVEGAEFVATCVSAGEDVEAVLFGAGGACGRVAPGGLVIDFSTIGPAAARRIGSRLGDAGLRFLDAPVTGGDVGARAGTLTVMVGGDGGDFERARPLLAAIGERATLCGPTGAGQAIKLCNQVLCALHMVALTEAMQLARALGADAGLVVDVCKTGAAGSWALENLGPRALQRRFEPGFMIKHLLKDLRLVLETPRAEARDGLPATELAAELFERVSRLQHDEGSGSRAGCELGTQALTLGYEASTARR